jgi:hypothetical protein
VSRDVDGCDLGQAEVPEQAWVDKGSDEATRRSINVDVNVYIALNEEVVDTLDVFVFASVSRAKDGAYMC